MYDKSQLSHSRSKSSQKWWPYRSHQNGFTTSLWSSFILFWAGGQRRWPLAWSTQYGHCRYTGYRPTFDVPWGSVFGPLLTACTRPVRPGSPHSFDPAFIAYRWCPALLHVQAVWLFCLFASIQATVMNVHTPKDTVKISRDWPRKRQNLYSVAHTHIHTY